MRQRLCPIMALCLSALIMLALSTSCAGSFPPRTVETPTGMVEVAQPTLPHTLEFAQPRPLESIRNRVVATGDFNGDAALDLILGGDFEATLLVNNGSDGFARSAVLPASKGALSIAVGDATGEGVPDVVLARADVSNSSYSSGLPTDSNVSLQLYPGNGADNFCPAIELYAESDSAGNSPAEAKSILRDLALGDLDGDSDLDVVLTGPHEARIIYLNTLPPSGNAPAQPPFCPPSNVVRPGKQAPLPESGPSSSVALGNLDGKDGLDIVVGLANAVQVYLNTPTDGLKLQPEARESTGTIRDIALGNFDRMHQLDIAVLTGSDGSDGQETGGELHVYASTPTTTGGLSFSVKDVAQISGQPTALALGDVNADGWLDAVASNRLQGHSRVLRYTGSTFEQLPELLDSQRSLGLTLADVNADSALDIVLASDEPAQLFLGLMRFTEPKPLSAPHPEKSDAKDVALGDLDGDGRLDLVFNSGDEQQGHRLVYRNQADGSFSEPLDLGSAPLASRVAVGDLNNDGKLDMVFGNYVYRNESSKVGSIAFSNGEVLPQSSAEGSDSFDVALAELDGDSRLDLVLTSKTADAQIYLNRSAQRGAIIFEPPHAIVKTVAATTIAIGNLNGDSLPDIALVGNRYLRVYQNDGKGNLSLLYERTDLQVNDLALGDLDDDGRLDLVVVNLHGNTQVYLNDDGRLDHHRDKERNKQPLFAQPVSLPDSKNQRGVALGDLNGDTKLDIVLVGPQANQAYLNDRSGRFPDPIVLPGSKQTNSAALGDLDGDGALDIVLVNDAGSQFYLSAQQPISGMPNNPPQVRIERPDLASAPDLSNAELPEDGVITFSYILSDAESDPVRAISATYSLDSGENWQPVHFADGKAPGLTTSPTGERHTFSWNTLSSGVFGQLDSVLVRLRVLPGASPARNGLPDRYQRAYAQATSPPFRLRGRQLQVYDEGRPDEGRPAVSGALVYRLRGGVEAQSTLLADAQGQPFHSNDRGYLRSNSVLTTSDELMAIWPITSTANYTIYHTSAAPEDNGIRTVPVTLADTQKLIVSARNPLMLLNLDLSLEWDARADARYLKQLHSDLRRTSQLLYDWTNGQVALGDLAIYHNKEKWNEADIRIYASNLLRPNADQGGITSEPITDPVSLRETNPISPPIIYRPGHVRIGAVWSRYGAGTGEPGEDWPRALAHELGHYALYLNDNYLGLQDGLLVPVENCPGAMSDPYKDEWNEFLPSSNNWAEVCKKTLSYDATKRSDWATITEFYHELDEDERTSDTELLFQQTGAGPSHFPLALTVIREVSPTQDTELPLPTTIFSLIYTDGNRVQPGPRARALLFPKEGKRVVDLGRPEFDEVNARGARPGDELCVYNLEQKQLGCMTIAAGDRALTIQTDVDWQPDVRITPETTNTIKVVVSGIGSNIGKDLTLQARLYTQNDEVSEPITLTAQEDGGYAGHFSLEDDLAALGGLVRLKVMQKDGTPAEPLREVVADYGLGSNPGPTANVRTAPIRAQKAPAISLDGQVVLYCDQPSSEEGQFVTLQVATKLLQPLPGWAKVVGQGYYLLGSPAALTLTRESSLSFGYANAQLSPAEEQGLNVYYYVEEAKHWERLPTRLSLAQDEAVARTRGPGLYALMSSYRLTLRNRGWTLIGNPAPGVQLIEKTLASLSQGQTEVYGYDSTTQRWSVYSTGVPTYVNRLNQLVFGQGYWITTTQASEAPTTTLLLSEGTTLLNKETEPYTDAARLASAHIPPPPAIYYGEVTGSELQEVEARIGDKPCGTDRIQVLNNNRPVYVVIVASDGEQEGCGASGREVVFRVGGEERLRRPWQGNGLQELDLTLP